MANSVSIPAGSTLGDSHVVFTFNGDYQTGQFCNGDWWVIGGAGRTITAISPACINNGSGTTNSGNAYSGRVMHGAQINPGCAVDVTHSTATDRNGQGADSYVKGSSYQRYASGLNVDPGLPGNGPISMAVPLTVAKWISLAVPNDGARPSVSDMVLLTVLATVPPADAFRPAQSASDKTILYRESGLNYALLPSLDRSKITTAPTLADALNNITRPLPIGPTNILGARNIFPANYQPGTTPYGQFYCRNWDKTYISLLLNYTQAEKRPLYIAAVQLGIDAIHRILQGDYFAGTGGCSMGLKFPAALCFLNFPIEANRGAIDPAHSVFPDGNYPEDRQLFTVTQAMTQAAVPYEPQYAYNNGALGYVVGDILEDADPDFDGAVRGTVQVQTIAANGTVGNGSGYQGTVPAKNAAGKFGDYYTQKPPGVAIPYRRISGTGTGTGLGLDFARRFCRFTGAYVDTPDWQGDAYNPNIPEGSNYDIPYRNICAYSFVGSHLGARLIPGMEALWNKPQFFEYMYRMMDWLIAPDVINPKGNGPTAFQNDAWRAYIPKPSQAAALVETSGFNHTAWLRFDYSLSRAAGPPDSSCFTVTEIIDGVPTPRTVKGVFIDGRGVQIDCVETFGG